MFFHLLVAVCAGTVAGLSIGCVGVGGVILVPVLVSFGAVPVHGAVASAMAGYIVTGLVGVVFFVRRGTLRLRSAVAPLLGAMPGAVAGALMAQAAPALILQLAIAVLAAASGLQILVRGARVSAARDGGSLGPSGGGLVGLVTGFVSALMGTGGPGHTAARPALARRAGAEGAGLGASDPTPDRAARDLEQRPRRRDRLAFEPSARPRPCGGCLDRGSARPRAGSANACAASWRSFWSACGVSLLARIGWHFV